MNKSLITLLVLLCCVGISICETTNAKSQESISISALLAYNKWSMLFKKKFSDPDQALYRQLIFFENLAKVNNHNKNKNKTYEAGINQFSDLTDEEFIQRMLNNQTYQPQQDDEEEQSGEQEIKLKQNVSVKSAAAATAAATPVLPTTLDWRQKGLVTPVKNQGNCGACWAFASIAVMESSQIKQTNTTKTFSEQQLIDCAGKKGFFANGCSGGFPEYAYRYAYQYGILTDAEYPYIAKEAADCKINNPTKGYYPTTMMRAKVYSNPNKIRDYLQTRPIGALINAITWKSYKSGVFNNCSKDNVQTLNHAILIVGYDAQNNWIVKNSWGTAWGENGYMTIENGNTCGIAIELFFQNV